MQHICNPVHTNTIGCNLFIGIDEKHDTNVWSCTIFPHATQLVSFMKYISRNICSLFHSVRYFIEIYWFVASYKYFIFRATCFKQFVSLLSAAPYTQKYSTWPTLTTQHAKGVEMQFGMWVEVEVQFPFLVLLQYSTWLDYFEQLGKIEKWFDFFIRFRDFSEKSLLWEFLFFFFLIAIYYR